ncbi:GRAM domain-containing protein 4-like isoform X2 [Acropora muricata]|uniref:GRAM domain-containing protein 4-like isoform X2 n=1 Tax=Acropora muricata TaxID=159855 RepID=UPI0034E47EE7
MNVANNRQKVWLRSVRSLLLMEENSKRRKRWNSELKDMIKPKQRTNGHQRRHSSPPDLRNGLLVEKDGVDRSGDTCKDTTKEDDFRICTDVNGNFLEEDEDRWKLSDEVFDEIRTQTQGIKSEESAASKSGDHRVILKVKTALGSWKGQIADMVLERLRDFINEESEIIDDAYIEGEPLAVKTLKENINRFSSGIKPITGFMKSIRNIFSWSNPAASFLIFVVYMYSVWHGYLLSLILFVAICKLFLNYLQARGINAHLGFTEKEKDETIPSEDYSWSDKFQLVLQVARKVQNTLGKIADSLEKMKNLLNWHHPEATGKLFGALCIGLVASLLLKGATLFTLIGLFLGIKFFVIKPIYNRFPKVKKRYDGTAKLWSELPTDAELSAKQNQAEGSSEKIPRVPSASSLSSLSTSSSSEHISGATANQLSEKFNLPPSETSLPGWEDGKKCTLLNKEKTFSNVKQGRLFLSQSYLCFEKIKSSSAKTIVIRLDTITSISKVKSSGIMPGTGTALEVHVRDMNKPYIFGGIIARDDVLENITLQM